VRGRIMRVWHHVQWMRTISVMLSIRWMWGLEVSNARSHYFMLPLMLQFSEDVFRDAEFVKLGLNVVDDIVDNGSINSRHNFIRH
jgi:hypothetical protein